MQTTERVRQLGLYTSSCCVEELVLDVNDLFPRCTKCEALCNWDFVERVFLWYELDEDLERLAA